MAITVVQTSTNGTAFAGGTTAGNTVYIIPILYTTTGTAITSSSPLLGGSSVSGTTKAQEVISPLNGSNGAYHAIWQLPNVPGGQTTYAITHNENQAGLMALEISGLGSAPATDQSKTGSDASVTGIDSGTSGATTHAEELIIGACATFAGSGAGPSGWTVISPNGNSWAATQIQSSSGATYRWQQTGSGTGPWDAGLITVYNTTAVAGSGALLAAWPV